MFKKLHFKLTVYMGLILVIFMFFIITGIYNFTRFISEDSAKKLMQAEAVRIHTVNDSSYSGKSLYYNKSITNNVIPRIYFIGSDRIEAKYISYDENRKRTFVDEDDINIALSIEKIAENSFETKKDFYLCKIISGKSYRIYTKYFNDINGQHVIQVYQDITNEEIIWSFLRTVLFVFGFTGMFILIGVSYILIGKALKPVTDTWIRQKEFVADASHELRTPLTVIQTNLDVVLSDDEGTVEENEMWLDNAYSETRVMAKLIDHLLILAKADANEEKLDISEFNMSEIVENVCGNMEMLANKKNIDFELIALDSVIVKGDYDKIRRLVVILIDNAIKYTEKGKVTVCLYTEKNKKIFTVQDTGIGICEKDLSRIFDRFYRADKARHRKGGTGLGLSIAKWIADIHRFSLTVESTVNVGSKFTLRM